VRATSLGDMPHSLSVYGDSRTRGLSQGEHLRADIHDVVHRVMDSMGGPDGVDRFLASTNFLPAITKHTPRLLAELEGIAVGANARFADLLAHNLMDEYWWWSQDQRHREACSSVASVGPPALVGQTMDLDRFLDGSQCLISHHDDSATLAVLTSAGMVGLCGVSSMGFGLCVNALTMLTHSGSGLPVAFAFRGALAQPDAPRALDFLRSVPHASGQHYAIVGRGPHGQMTASIECSARGATTSAEANSNFGHANHPLASADIDSHASTGAEGSSALRQSALEAALPSVTNADGLMHLLSTEPLCEPRRDDRDWFTFGAIVAQIDDVVTINYALGPPDTDPWHTAVVA